MLYPYSRQPKSEACIPKSIFGREYHHITPRFFTIGTNFPEISRIVSKRHFQVADTMRKLFISMKAV
jgi:hypothetical protein